MSKHSWVEKVTQRRTNARLGAKVNMLEKTLLDENEAWTDRLVAGCMFPTSDRILNDLRQEPLLLARAANGGWMSRAEEAGAWLCSILRRRLCTCPHTTIHALKSTPLSWCGKMGLSPEIWPVLDHRSSGKPFANAFAGNVLAQPFREYEMVLQQFRIRSFRPDSPRAVV